MYLTKAIAHLNWSYNCTLNENKNKVKALESFERAFSLQENPDSIKNRRVKI